MSNKIFFKSISILFGSLLLSACGDQVAAVLEGQEARAERYHEEGKAVGNACRHAGRAIEDCYTIYNWLPRSGIFEGWREMDKYMRKYSLEGVKPILPPPENPHAPKKEDPPKKKKKKSADKNNENNNNNNDPANKENMATLQETNDPSLLAINPTENPDQKSSGSKDKNPDADNPNKIKVETTPEGKIIIK